ncbi:hypothetical protein GPJ61_27780 [Brevibacillus formosus]|uniref:hypothetical protein n=1 Tax=Brevibacillus formosus TaxID=54913 RepID=UPI001CA4CD1D|nr:hypothetical protein [Brevibacillus formosus]MBW5471591.1 hypothetical protein [Brevibacillus formosus]
MMSSIPKYSKKRPTVKNSDVSVHTVYYQTTEHFDVLRMANIKMGIVLVAML